MQDCHAQDLCKIFSVLDVCNPPQHRDEPSDNTPLKDQESATGVLEIAKTSTEVQTIDTNDMVGVVEISKTSTEAQMIDANDTATGGTPSKATQEPSEDLATSPMPCNKPLHKQVQHLCVTVQTLQTSQEQDRKKIDNL